jgi:UDP-glucuronate 4-epimerase
MDNHAIFRVPAAWLAGRRFLVTGGAGFIGSHLVDALLDNGASVLCVDDFNDYYDPDIKAANVAAHCDHPRYSLVRADIRDREKLMSLVQGYSPDQIVHLAARAGVRPSLSDPFLYQETNVRGTLNILEAARRAGVRRVTCASSSSVYGDNTRSPFAESDAVLLPASPYGATKLAGEALCQVYARNYGLDITSLRFFTVYGPRQRPDMAINKFARKILRGEVIPLYGDGSSQRDYTYVQDIIAGVVAATDYGTPGHHIFNLGNGSPITLLQLLEALEKALDRPARRCHLPEQPGDVASTFADPTRARRELGFQARVPIEVGLAAYVASISGPDSKPLAA